MFLHFMEQSILFLDVFRNNFINLIKILPINLIIVKNKNSKTI